MHAGQSRGARVNVLTHLTFERVRARLAAGTDLVAAVAAADSELVAALPVGPDDLVAAAAPGEATLAGGPGSAYLLAVTGVLLEAAEARRVAAQTATPTPHLQEFLNQLQADLADDGALSLDLIAELQVAEALVDAATLASHLANRYAASGVDAEPGDADTVLDADHDGVPNAFDLCPWVADPAQTDADGDGVGDACAPAVCGDGVADVGELCAEPLAMLPTGPGAVRLVDLDSDGDDEVVVLGDDVRLHIWTQTGATNATGGYEPWVSGVIGAEQGWTPGDVFARDVVGDEALDVLTTFHTGKSLTLAVFEGSADGLAPPSVLLKTEFPGCALAVDTDSDGTDEIVLLRADGQGVVTVLTDGDGGVELLEAPTATPLGSSCESVVRGDLDGDGLDDLLVPRHWSVSPPGTAPWLVLRSTGDGGWLEVGEGPQDGLVPLAAADLDPARPGDELLVVAETSDLAQILAFGGGGAPWTTLATGPLAAPPLGATAASPARLAPDGPESVLTRSGSDLVAVGLAAGALVVATSEATLSPTLGDVFAADLDGDGRSDAVHRADGAWLQLFLTTD